MTTALLPGRGLRYEVRETGSDIVLSTHTTPALALAGAERFRSDGLAVVAVETVYLTDGTIWQDEL